MNNDCEYIVFLAQTRAWLESHSEKTSRKFQQEFKNDFEEFNRRTQKEFKRLIDASDSQTIETITKEFDELGLDQTKIFSS